MRVLCRQFNQFDFNSIKVRLEHRATGRYIECHLRFQFHKGTIRTGHRGND